ncbi:MAG: hypothetical protein N2037_09855 [Acidimicrobiales bacterium]|nr:hypothetical protein [Acidimicrobiales bacterium]
MTDTLGLLMPLVQSQLKPGEELIAAVRVNYNGATQPNTFSFQAGLASIPGAETTFVGKPDPDLLVSFPSANQMAVGLTGGRLLVTSLGFRGKPKAFLGSVPLSAVVEVHAGEVRFGQLVRLVLKSGASVDLELMKGEDGDTFFENLKALVGAGTDNRAIKVDPVPPPTPIISPESAGGGSGD